MIKTDPADVYGYVCKWITFQERYNEVLPAIPIYSNIYFDFFTPYLQNYNITAHVTWSQAILEAWFGDAPRLMRIRSAGPRIHENECTAAGTTLLTDQNKET